MGENLQDHVTTLLGPFLINKPITFSLARLMVNPFKIWEYVINGTGPLTTTVAGDSIGFIKTNKSGSIAKLIKLTRFILGSIYLCIIKIMQIRK